VRCTKPLGSAVKTERALGLVKGRWSLEEHESLAGSYVILQSRNRTRSRKIGSNRNKRRRADYQSCGPVFPLNSFASERVTTSPHAPATMAIGNSEPKALTAEPGAKKIGRRRLRARGCGSENGRHRVWKKSLHDWIITRWTLGDSMRSLALTGETMILPASHENATPEARYVDDPVRPRVVAGVQRPGGLRRDPRAIRANARRHV
jgi:hypothetical protein